MPEIIFSHPKIQPPLHVGVKPDQIAWAYGLNTQSYPTYGGEVVQILSIYVGDLTIKGTVSSYAHMETIYGWFIAYMQYATQGTAGKNHLHYNQQPVKFEYPERGWTFQIWPKALPGFRYGRDVVAPEWSLVAAIKEPDEQFSHHATAYALGLLQNDNLDPAGVFKVTADFGTTGDLENNPWASPDATAGKDMNAYLKKAFASEKDQFNKFLQSYEQNQLDNLPQFRHASGPPNLTGTKKANTKKSGKVKKK